MPNLAPNLATENRRFWPMLLPCCYSYATMCYVVCRIALVITTLDDVLWFVAQVAWSGSMPEPEPRTTSRTLSIYHADHRSYTNHVNFFTLASPLLNHVTSPQTTSRHPRKQLTHSTLPTCRNLPYHTHAMPKTAKGTPCGLAAGGRHQPLLHPPRIFPTPLSFPSALRPCV